MCIFLCVAHTPISLVDFQPFLLSPAQCIQPQWCQRGQSYDTVKGMDQPTWGEVHLLRITVSLAWDNKQLNTLIDNKWEKCTYTDKIKFSTYIGKFRVQQLQSHTYMRKGFLIYEEMRKYFPMRRPLQLLHSEFPYKWGKFDFLFYQCTVLYSTAKTFAHWQCVYPVEVSLPDQTKIIRLAWLTNYRGQSPVVYSILSIKSAFRVLLILIFGCYFRKKLFKA